MEGCEGGRLGKEKGEKEREQGAKRANVDDLRWGDGKVGVPGRFFGNVYEYVYPAAGRGRCLRAGGDAHREEEGNEWSEQLQGVPPGYRHGETPSPECRGKCASSIPAAVSSARSPSWI
jgi:hypothetical protein